MFWRNSRPRSARRAASCAVASFCAAYGSAYALPNAPEVRLQPETPLIEIVVAAPSPLPGVGIDRDRVPGQTSVLNRSDISREGAPDALRALQDQVGGVTLDSASGNPYQPTLFYHGFAASPLQGTPQGLAVYLDGVRFNQAFGDTVNFDLIPDLAINRIDVVGSNPVFGLNALGGSLNIQLKNGFTYHGAELVLSGGSFGQAQAQGQYGIQLNDGSQSLYGAGTILHNGGWRDGQSSDIYNFHGDAGARGDSTELHLGVTAASTALNGPGTAPVELLSAAPRAQFTAPNLIANKYIQVSLSGIHDVTDTLSGQGSAYYSNFEQRVVNGNAPSNFPCASGNGLLCQGDGVTPSTTRGGLAIPDFLVGGPYSQLDRQTTTTNSYGASLQATSTGTLLGRNNHLVGGISFDGAQTGFGATSLIGGSDPLSRVFSGPGIVLAEPSIFPVRLDVSNAYYGAFATDTLSVTRRLDVTLSGRFNAAEIDLQDRGGGGLTGQHSYNRFNPAAGAAYKLAPWLTAYAGYSEANRAPTPAELSCAGPNEACSLANFFVGDPNLKQVIAHTVEAGVRGSFDALGGRLNYNLGFFHTDLNDDIVYVNSATPGRAFFANVGQTRRQGIDTGLQFKTKKLLAYVNYALTDATYRTPFLEGGGNNPSADANGLLSVRRGARLPGVPESQVKFGVQYQATDAWSLGVTAVAASEAVLFGDQANLTPKLPAYVVLNLNASYQLTPNVQLFGLVQNAAGQRYYTYGTFSPTSSVALAQVPGATNPRSYSLAAPIGGFGGIRATF